MDREKFCDTANKTKKHTHTHTHAKDDGIRNILNQ